MTWWKTRVKCVCLKIPWNMLEGKGLMFTLITPSFPVVRWETFVSFTNPKNRMEAIINTLQPVRLDVKSEGHQFRCHCTMDQHACCMPHVKQAHGGKQQQT